MSTTATATIETFGAFRVRYVDGGYRVSFAYTADRVIAVKAAGGRNYDTPTKSWYIPDSCTAQLKLLIDDAVRSIPIEFERLDEWTGIDVPEVGEVTYSKKHGYVRITSVRRGRHALWSIAYPFILTGVRATEAEIAASASQPQRRSEDEVLANLAAYQQARGGLGWDD